MFKSLLIANRGEIACRVIRACRQLEIEPITIFSSVDQNALHAQQGDRGELIGSGPAADQSYLLAEEIVAKAVEHGAEAIHPGYGFLSENARFAELCAESGITFVGPRPDTIRTMGDKIAARRCAAEAGVPIIPGSNVVEGIADATGVGEEVGYPLMVKASAGGGGMGIQLVERPEQLEEAIKTAQIVGREAFGNGDVYIERFLRETSHIEVQVIGDKHGNAVHLLERDCSVQRRNQKVIEETPSQLLDPQRRAAICESALKLVRHIGYDSVGTLEFLMEPDGRFYFLEMNTRIQVEHPITEAITGRDLIDAQIRVAAGERLPFKQEDIAGSGHAIEARVLAEDSQTMLPSPGLVTGYREPRMDGVRIDSGIAKGVEVPSVYDSLVAKVIAHGETREEARRRLIHALRLFRINGILTNISMLLRILESEHFRGGRYSTSILQLLSEEEEAEQPTLERVAAVVALIHSDRAPLRRHFFGSVVGTGRQVASDNWWRPGGTLSAGWSGGDWWTPRGGS